jgi:biopolymer transport protein TolQ
MVLKYFLGMSPVIMIVLGILIFFSVGSWGIMIYKMLLLNKVKKVTKRFIDFFWDTKEFGLINSKLDGFKDCPLALVFKEGYRETEHFMNMQTEIKTDCISTDLSAIDNISRSLRKVSSIEIEKIEKDIGFLATTGATTPFIGLFGTVWGIMNAFQSIGNAGSTSLDIVAPGISEALITTAIGLAVAIPAVIGYNYIQGKIKSVVGEIDTFTYDFLNIVQRIFSASSGSMQK